MSKTQINRKTRETDVTIGLDLYGPGEPDISTGIGFFDHMLHSFAVHSGFELSILAKGDLHIDNHHTVEDVGIVLGQAIRDQLGDKSGIMRFGDCYVPMDESLALCVIDVSGRPFNFFDCPLKDQMIGTFEAAMLREFFRAVAVNAGITIHIKVMYGENSHHIIEAIFKSFARALGQAVSKRTDGTVLSAKGIL